MGSFGHDIRKLTDEEREHFAKIGFHCTAGTRRCDAAAVFDAVYSYVTGKAGRVSSVLKHYCEPHAAQFAEKHGICMECSVNVPPSSGPLCEECHTKRYPQQGHATGSAFLPPPCGPLPDKAVQT